MFSHTCLKLKKFKTHFIIIVRINIYLFLIVINLLKASIYVFDKNFNYIERVAKAFLLCKVKSDLTFNASLLLLFASTLLLFIYLFSKIRLISKFNIIKITTLIICLFDFSTIKIEFLKTI